MSDALDCAPYAISSTYPKGKVFSNHTHVALSSSLTIFTLPFGLTALAKATLKGLVLMA